MIDGVIIRELVTHVDEHGYLFEMLRSDWPEFSQFGQSYVSVTYPGVIKGWHIHKLQTDHFVIVKGMAKIALYDDRPDSPTRHELMEVVMGERRQRLLVIPPNIMHGTLALNNEPVFVVNFPDFVYNAQSPDEHRLPYDMPLLLPDGTEKPYCWFQMTEDDKHK
jgi:dTDP-4-dehydrorhamnose 3,5-epimerase